MEFKRGDICICKRKLYKRTKKTLNGRTIQLGNIGTLGCKVRITSLSYENKTGQCYNVYNIDLERYEKIEGRYLELDISQTRENRLNEILNEE